ncbi:MAG: VOC family protein [Pseudomonadota bacterium]
MEQRISLITLAVADLAASAEFYAALGWQKVETEDGVVAFDLFGQTLGLYPKEDLARDMGLEADSLGGFSGVTLGHNVREKAEVGILMARAEAAGANVIKRAHDVFWGGHIGYFADPDGHVWEIGWNPFSPLGPDGAFQWNGA